MMIIDSSAWIEYLSGGPRAGRLAKYFTGSGRIIIPSLVIYEVYKKIKSERGEPEAVLVVAQMERVASDIVAVDHSLAILAADIALQKRLPMADAIIYAVSDYYQATLITLDSHFKGLERVEYFG